MFAQVFSHEQEWIQSREVIGDSPGRGSEVPARPTLKDLFKKLSKGRHLGGLDQEQFASRVAARFR